MKIGLDLDGVIVDTENVFRVKAELYDLLELHKKGQVNNLLWAQKRYDWNEEETQIYIEKYILEAEREASFKAGVIQVVEMLRKDGHEIILITARGQHNEEERKIAEKQLREANLVLDKYYWGIQNKVAICEKEDIDVMIDDSYEICKNMEKNHIMTFYFRDVNREKLEQGEYLKEVNTWGEIYRYIYEREEAK